MALGRVHCTIKKFKRVSCSFWVITVTVMHNYGEQNAPKILGQTFTFQLLCNVIKQVNWTSLLEDFRGKIITVISVPDYFFRLQLVDLFRSCKELRSLCTENSTRSSCHKFQKSWSLLRNIYLYPLRHLELVQEQTECNGFQTAKTWF